MNNQLIKKSHQIKLTIKLSDKHLKVLIAGCGTGKQILQAVKYKNSQITAIDLSLSSLAYAKRKLDEIGIKNVELIQMDILEIQLLKQVLTSLNVEVYCII